MEGRRENVELNKNNLKKEEGRLVEKNRGFCRCGRKNKSIMKSKDDQHFISV